MTTFRKDTSRKGAIVYQEVLQKNFQIIETFLKKFHQIFTKQDQFQENITRFNQKFNQYDDILDDFKQENKHNFIMIQKKINNMKSTVRQSQRSSRGYSKTPHIDQNAQLMQKAKNFTSLKFGSIQTQIVQKNKVLDELTLKNNQLTKSIEHITCDINQIKDKINFLTIYTSKISNSIESSSLQQLRKDLTNKIQQRLNQFDNSELDLIIKKLQHAFIQKIQQLEKRFNNNSNQSFNQKINTFNHKIKHLQEDYIPKEQFTKLQISTKQDFRILAGQCKYIFADKQQTKKHFSLIQKKFNKYQSLLKQQTLKKEQQSVKQINNCLRIRTPSACSNRVSKSKSNLLKKKHPSQIIQQVLQINKQNDDRSSVQESLSTALFTSSISKDFMKNFGQKQKKLLKHIRKSDLNQTNSFHFSNLEKNNLGNRASNLLTYCTPQ